MAPKKGFTNNPNGRPPGTPNKITTLTKEMIESVLSNRTDDINAALNKLKDDPAKFIEAISKLLPYIIARKTDVTSGDEVLPSNININVTTPESAEKLKDFLNDKPQ